jgi:hypothetical protein
MRHPNANRVINSSPFFSNMTTSLPLLFPESADFKFGDMGLGNELQSSRF